MYKHILVPLDGSPLAERALSHAVTLASQFQSQITLIQVVPPVYTPMTPEMVMAQPVISMEQLLEEAESYVKSRQAELRAEGLVVHRKVVEGPIAESILGFAEGQTIDLIVMSTHGRSGIGRWIYGSVAQKVLQGAKCPILLIRAME